MVTMIGKHGVSYARTAPATSLDYTPRHAAPVVAFNATVQRLMGYGFTRSIASRMARRNATA